MGKFCFKCGRDTEKSGMCESCAAEEMNTVEDRKMEVIECSQCSKVKIANSWIEFEPSGLFKRKLKVRHARYKIINEDKRNSWFLVDTEKGKFAVKVHFNRLVCGVCGRRKSGFYTAVIQLRGSQLKDKVFEEVLNLLDAEKGDMRFYDIRRVQGGYDFRIGSKSAAEHVVRALKKKYHLDIVRSFKIVTRKDGQDVKRNIVCVRV